MVSVSANQLTKRYGRLTALEDVSFEVQEGQVLGLLGQNGAGKSTLLNILSGYFPPSSGDVRVLEKDMLMNPLHAKAHIGYLPENPPLYTEMTVAEYLHFCCKLKGVVSADVASHIEEIKQITGLSDVSHRLIAHLSRGYRQRVGLAQALCGNPEVLLLDEPTAGFDPSQVVEFRGIISSLAKRHTIIFSSHILSEVQAICQRVLILHHGRLVADEDLRQKDGRDNRRFRLRTAMNKERMLPALRGLPSVSRVKITASDHTMSEAIIETKSGSAFERELLTLFSGLQVPILALVPMQDTLEDIFLRITSGANAPREA